MRARVLLLPLVAAAAFLGGCATAAPTSNPSASPTPTDNGISALPVDQILSKATDALKATTSFHVKGSMTSQGIKADIDVVYAGANAKGTLTFQGIAIDVIRVGADTYAKAPDAFWATVIPTNLQATVLPMLTGKYAKVPATLATLLPTPDELVKPSGTPTKGAASTVNGTPVITLVDSDGSKLYIATMGAPLPVEIEGTDGLKIDFTDINAPATVDAPAAADVVDATALLGGS